ncbi:MAG: hypothetical protein IJG18_06220 [Kiritimatiellae bacterium]|nr:hypothetical protein [Kiritimatiellia bacterium]
MKKITIAALSAMVAGLAQTAPMMTEWGEKVAPENAWRGYPRPQMVRANWTNLNGEWDYAVTSVTNTPGRPEKWDGKILVPFPIESALSGVGRLLKPDEFLWYTRTIECDPKPGERILLHFGGVDFRTMVFIGHDEVTDVPHEGGQNPFTVDITDFVKKGENELTVCVWDPTEDFVNSRGKQSFNPSGCFYTRVSGIWQTVWMETVPEKYIKSYKVFTDIDKGEVTLTFRGTGNGEPGTVEILCGSVPLRETFIPGIPCTIRLPAPVALWSPENPKLYNFTAKYGKDEIKGYFGMRKIEKRRDEHGYLRFFLNNKPYFMIGTLDQGWWPDGLLTPPSEEAMEYDVKVLKDCGFNMLRKHIKVEPQQYYAMCDRLGILVIQDLPSGTGSWKDPIKADTVKRYWLQRQEMKEMMDDLQSFTCIVMWNPYNEGWSQPGEFLTHSMLDFTKRHDPTRLVNAPSGCWDWEGGHLLPEGWKWEKRVLTQHKPDGVCEAADTVDMHLYRGPTMFAVNDRRISFLGEFGGLGHPVPDHLWKEPKDGKGNWGYGGIEDTKTREGLEKTYLGLMDRLGQLAEWGLGGSVYTQTTDVEIEINGLLTYDRKVLKYNPEVLKKAHAEVIRRALDAPRTGLLHLSHVHRGGGKLERPDNTLDTFTWCWENGSALECDCRKTKDGVGVMLHDDNLKRTGRGISAALAGKSVSKELTWDEIKNVDVGSYLDPKFSHHRIPTIEATFAAMKGHPTYLCFVDEKGAGPEYIAEKAREAGVLDQIYYTGQDYQKALDWNRATNGGKTLIWIGTWPKPKHTAEDIARFEEHFEKKMDEMRANHFKGVSAVSLHTYYDPKADEPFVPRASYLRKIIAEFHANGIPVCSIPFEGGETEEVYFKLHELGCDGFSTDYPSVMFSVIRKLKDRK